MSRRRGFFAELQHQQAVAARNRQRAEAAATREHARLLREMERVRRAQEQAAAARTRAGIAAAQQAEKDRARLHAESRATETDLLNVELEVSLSDLDNLLSATLDVDDYVDLEALRVVVEHPPFRSDHQAPALLPQMPQTPPEPTFVPPPAPTGMSAMLGGKKKHLAAMEQAQQHFNTLHRQWQQEAARVPALQLQRMNAYQAAEQQRLAKLEADSTKYRAQCEQRQQEADKENARLDDLIRGLAAGDATAVEEYLGIVFSNSVYPDYFDGVNEWSFDAGTGELTISFDLPRPDQLPMVRQYRYVKARDEISATPQPQKEQRDRYASVVHQVALRTLHEVWESDRAGHVRTIAFTGAVVHIDPATGHESRTTLIQLAVEREQFNLLELRNVTPSETLRHLNANVSKNPHGLISAATGPSVRGH